MKLKTITTSATIIAATLVGSTLTISPAHALSGKFSIDLNDRVTSVLSTGIDLLQDTNSDSIDDSFGFNNKTGDFSSYTGAFVKDLSFGTTLVNGVNPDFTPLNPTGFITLTGASGTITFDLTKLTNVIFSNGSDGSSGQGTFLANVRGIFQPSGSINASNIDAIASFRLSQGGNGGAIDLTAVPIPTPALLPGLIALGAGVIRKRKTKSSEA